MKDVTGEKKAREKKELLENFADITAPAEVAQASSSVDLTRKYI